MAIPVIGLGAGGHAKVVIEILQTNDHYKIVGLLDRKPELQNQCVLGIRILGNDKHLQQWVDEGIQHFFVGLGSAGDTRPRQRLYEFALKHGLQAVNAIHPGSVISPSATLGAGITLAAMAVINTSAVVGQNVIVNTGAIVEHDCVIGDHVHIATGARLAGAVHVGNSSHIGVGASVRQCIAIGSNVIVGAGAVVVDDVPNNVIVVGVPAKIMRAREK